MNKLLMRLIVVLVVVAAVYGGSAFINRGLGLPDVALPPVDFGTMPMNFGVWRGQDEKLADDVFKAVGHDMLVNRSYKPGNGLPISLHCAVFKDQTVGINHNPKLCYGLSGWTLVSDEAWPIKMNDGRTVPINFLTWEEGGKQVRVIYWFQFGDRFVKAKWDFGIARFDMAWERFKSGSKEPWPALIKVLMQTAATGDETADKNRIQPFVQYVYDWTNANYGYRASSEAKKETDAPAAEPAKGETETPAAATESAEASPRHDT